MPECKGCWDLYESQGRALGWAGNEIACESMVEVRIQNAGSVQCLT